MALAPSERPHYVNNKDFVTAVVAYVAETNAAREAGKEPKRIPEYIGNCFMAIAERSSRRSNFVSYPFREEMVMDGVQDCVKAIMNYKIDAQTRGGAPNAFGYFTQIVFYAFIRRIKAENHQKAIREKYRDHADIDSFADFGDSDSNASVGSGMIARIRHRNDVFHGRGDAAKEEVCEALKPKKRGFPPRKPKDPAVKKPTVAKKPSLEQFLS